MMKICVICKIEKPLDCFTARKDAKDGLRGNCKDCANVRSKKWVKENREKRREIRRNYYQTHKEFETSLNAKWHKENGNITGHWARYKDRCPAWLSEDQKADIVAFYKESERLSRATGTRHDVDHIIPIGGKRRMVSGLHVPWNLQVITKAENKSKFTKLPSEGQFLAGGS